MQGVGVQQPVYTRGEQEWSVVQSEAETRLVTYNHAPRHTTVTTRLLN